MPEQGLSVPGTRSMASELEGHLEALQAIVQGSLDIITLLDADGTVVYSSSASTRVLGYDHGDMFGPGMLDLVHPDDVDRVTDSFVAAFEGAGLTVPVEFRFRHQDGSWRTLESVSNNLTDHPLINGYVITTRDVTDRAAAAGALRASEERYRRLVERSPEAIAVHQEGVFVYVNPACVHLLGAEVESELLGRSVIDFVFSNEPHAAEPRWHALESATEAPLREERLIRLDGQPIDIDVVGVAITFGSGPAVQVMIRDITDRKRAQAALAHQALHDHLTGLPNRTLLLDRLTQALVRAQGHRGRVAVLFLDLDRFKVVNDSLGHDAGDRLLVAVTSRLQGIMRTTDTLARVGGDEFVIVVDDAADLADVTGLADRISAVLNEPVNEGEHELRVQISIGIAISTDSDMEPGDLIRDADAAMYRAKERGRARYEIFDAAMRTRALGRVQDENALRHAIERNELRVHYQPILEVQDSALVGMEALLRWEHPERGLLRSSEFISVAEESGLIVPIATWVFEVACRQAQVWAEQVGRPIEIAMNLSARQVAEPHIVKLIAHLLHDADMDPTHVSLCLEISETLAMQDPDHTADILGELKSLGVGLAISDFGSGYSSLAHLRRFEVDVLKIDRSFVVGLDTERGNQAIVAAIIELGHAMQLNVVAEGVETHAEMDVLRLLRCDRAQGPLFAAPQPPLALTGFIHTLGAGAAPSV